MSGTEKFKVGDTVRIVQPALVDAAPPRVGRIGKVVDIDPGDQLFPFSVEADGLGAAYSSDELILMGDSARERVPPKTEAVADAIEQPAHYAGKSIEPIDAIESWGLDGNYYLGNVVKYVARHADKGKPVEDLKKARQYLTRAINALEGEPSWEARA